MGHINMSIYWDWYNSCPPAFFHSCKCVTSPLSNQKPCKRQLSTITPLFCAKLMRRINARQIGHLTYLTCNYSAAENYRNITLRAVMIFILRSVAGIPKFHELTAQCTWKKQNSGESLFLRKLVLGIPSPSGKNLTRPLMPSAPQTSCVRATSPRPS